MPDNTTADKEYLLKMIAVLDREAFDKLYELCPVRNQGRKNNAFSLRTVFISGEYAQILLKMPTNS